MKKVLLLITILTIILAVFCGCAPVPGEIIDVQENTEYQILLNSGSCFVYTFKDEDAGVWYIATCEGITPRLNSDGSLYTDKNK